MIQRPQTLFLLGCLILMAASVSLPSWVGIGTELKREAIVGAYNIKVSQSINNETNVYSHFYPAISGVLSVLISLISIFMFKNRMLQMKLGMVNSLIIASFVGLIQLVNIVEAKAIIGSQEPGEYQIGFYLPLIAVFLNMFSNRFIKKDEALVRSVDRIR